MTPPLCPDCLRDAGEQIAMVEIDRDCDWTTYPVSGPEVTRVKSITYKCPVCGETFRDENV